MKISINKFMGRIPRLGDTRLPKGFAKVAQNVRLLSGDLEGWLDLGTGYTLPKGGAIRGLHLMDRDKDVAATSNDLPWLHWNSGELGTGQVSVDAVRGPVQGDTTERTYFTGTDVPRVTNITKALDESDNGDPGTYQYPYSSWKLGVPAPDDAPTVVQDFSVFESGQIPIVNPGAESGVTGWTVVQGSLVSTDLGGAGGHSGSFAFGGGTASFSEAKQELDIDDLGISRDGSVTLSWWQKSDANDTAGMGIEFLDVDKNVLPGGTTTIELEAHASWNQRTVSNVAVPPDAFYINLVQQYDLIDAGPTIAAYIDDIEFSNAGSSISNDGSGAEDWDTSGYNSSVDSGFTIDNTIGNPQPSWRMRAVNDEQRVTATRDDLDLLISPLIELNFDFRRSGSGSVAWPHIKIGADTNNNGPTIAVGGGNIYYGEGRAWQANRLVNQQKTPTQGGHGKDEWFTVNIVAEQKGESIYDLTIVSTPKDGSPATTLTVEGVEFKGTRIGVGFHAELSGLETELLNVDNIFINVSPKEFDPDANLSKLRFTNYVYTFVNEFGEESAPSLPSNTVRYADDGRIATTVTTSTSTDAGYGVNSGETSLGKKRIYRSVDAGDGVAVFALVAEIPLSQAEYTDTVADEDLGELLPSAGWNLPPTDGHSMLTLPNGITAMAAKNEFAPSVQNRPHAYPINFRLATDYPIVAMGAIDTVVVLATEAHPYLVQGSTPATLSMQKLELPQGCVSKRGLVSLKGWGVIYPSPDGLIGVSGSSAPRILTEQVMSRREWQALSPETIVAFAHDDRYFGFYDNGTKQAGFIFDPLGRDGFGWVDLDIYAVEGFSDALTDTLYLVVSGDVQAWEGSSSKISYTWRSGLLRLPRPASFAVAQVWADDYTDLTVKFYANGVLIHTKTVTSHVEFNLPATEPYEDWEVQFEGTSRVQEVDLAEDVMELAT